MPARRWFEKAFGPTYLELYGHRDEREAARAVQVLTAHLPGLDRRPGDDRATVLDIACGAGRYLDALARRGIRAVGIDLSGALLERARGVAGGRLVRGDMRCLPFRDGAFGAAISMFTSFGYFARLSENEEVLHEAHRVLDRSGGLAVDYLNTPVTLARLVPESRRKIGGREVVDHRRVEPGADGVDRIIKTTEIWEEGRPVETLYEEVMALDPGRLKELLDAAGFEIMARFGDYDGHPFDAARSPRCFLVCRRVP